MELLNKILGDFLVGVGLMIGYMCGLMIFMPRISWGQVVGNGLALLLGWILGGVVMFYAKKLYRKIKK